MHVTGSSSRAPGRSSRHRSESNPASLDPGGARMHPTFFAKAEGAIKNRMARRVHLPNRKIAPLQAVAPTSNIGDYR